VCLISLAEKWSRSNIRKRADSGDFNRHTCRAMRATGVCCIQPASPATVKKEEDGVGV